MTGTDKVASTPTRVSIIVPCRNEAAHIRALLDAIDRQEGLDDFDWEAIVADGCSDDGTAQIIEAYAAEHPRIKLIRNPGRSVSTGLNQAIRLARGQIIVRMDVHTLYAPDYCCQSIRALIASGADNVGGPACTVSRGWIQKAVAAAYRSRFSTGGARFHDPHYEGFVDTVPYGCWWKATFDAIGMFDEHLARNQDDELNLRLIRRGGKIWQTPAIRSWYMPRASLCSLFRQYFQYGFWKVAVIQKHRVPASVRHLVPALFVAGNVLLLLTMATYLVFGSRSEAYMLAIEYVMDALYLLVVFVASVVAARRDGWTLLWILPLVFTIYHLSYGSGFITGLYHQVRRGRSQRRIGEVFTELTR